MNAETQRGGEEQRRKKNLFSRLSPRSLHLCISAFIFSLTLIVFFQARHFDFLNYDDGIFVVDNPHVLGGLTPHAIGWAWTTVYISYWQPITWMSHMLDVSLYGLNPGGHHLTSVLIHAINGVLVFLVLSSLTRSTWKSAIVAALFAVHPLRMESVAWISERKDVLCALFYLLTIWAYGKYARGGGAKWYAATIGIFCLGIACKPMIVSLPGVLLLLDAWPLKRSTPLAKLVLEKVPFVVLSLAVSIAAVISQQKGQAIHTGELSFGMRIGNAIWAYARYLKKTILPNDLAAFYPYLGHVPGTVFPWDKVAVSLVLLIVISIVALLAWKRERAVLVGWLWFLGVLVPTIGLLQVGVQSMADRYSYLPQIGLFIAVVWGLGALVERWPGIKGLAVIVAAGSIAIFAGCTAYQLHYWQNSQTLFKHAMTVTESNAMAARSVGMYLSAHGRDAEAENYYIEALRIDPGDPGANANLANLLAARGDTANALEHAERAVQLVRDDAEFENNLANILAQVGRSDEAIAHHKKAIALDPDLAEAHFNYGVTLAQLGRVREAVPELKRAIDLRPDYANARYVYGVALWTLGDRGGAVEQFRSALDCHPNPVLRAQIETRLRSQG